MWNFVNQILESGGSNISKQINKNNQTLFLKQCVGMKIRIFLNSAF